MNEITAITPQIKDKKRCNIFIDGRFYCGLTLETTVKNRLKVGQIISPDTLSQIQLESEKGVALDKALTHISATRKTEKQVRDFLSQKGYLSTVIDYVIEKMKGYGFLNDAEYAGQDFGERMNLDSEPIYYGKAEPYLAESPDGKQFQLMRIGYYKKQTDENGKLVLSEIVSLKDNFNKG